MANGKTKVKLLNGSQISRCPRCKHEHLLEFEGDAFCMKCSWDSIGANVESLGLLSLFSQKNSLSMEKDETEFLLGAS